MEITKTMAFRLTDKILSKVYAEIGDGALIKLVTSLVNGMIYARHSH